MNHESFNISESEDVDDTDKDPDYATTIDTGKFI